jgi:hypothetical protein
MSVHATPRAGGRSTDDPRLGKATASGAFYRRSTTNFTTGSKASAGHRPAAELEALGRILGRPAGLSRHREVDFRKVRVKRNRYARRIAAEGLVVQVGRGRPKRLLESGGTTPRSVRFSDEIWKLLARRAKAKGLTLHAALREAILEWARDAA